MINFATIQDFNDYFGLPTQHPLVSVINMYDCKPIESMRHTMSFYAIFLKEEKNCELIYGRTHYDYDKGDVVCMAPGQVIGVENGGVVRPAGYGLFFDPDLIHGTNLGRHIKDYSFFGYEVNEALHVSDSERKTLLNCLKMIKEEIGHDIDRLSKPVITSLIETMLNYCQRFYERQFETRKVANSDILARFETLLDNYFKGNNARKNGLPSVASAASELCLSANYFGDLIKKETGRTAQEIIKAHILDASKEALLDTTKSITEVSDSLGFQYPQHFSRFIKKELGITPAKYREEMTA